METDFAVGVYLLAMTLLAIERMTPHLALHTFWKRYQPGSVYGLMN